MLSLASVADLSSELDAFPFEHYEKAKTTIVFDADRTLSQKDISNILSEALGVSDQINAIFNRYEYIDNAFLLVSQVWSSVNAKEYATAVDSVSLLAKNNLLIRSKLADFMKKNQKEYPIFVVTAGSKSLWRKILNHYDCNNVVVLGGVHDRFDNYVVSPETKKEIVCQLQLRGFKVIAIGDSPIDAGMLNQANAALLVEDGKGNKNLKRLISRNSDLYRLKLNESVNWDYPLITLCKLIKIIES